MGKSHPQALRSRVIAFVGGGYSQTKMIGSLNGASPAPFASRLQALREGLRTVG